MWWSGTHHVWLFKVVCSSSRIANNHVLTNVDFSTHSTIGTSPYSNMKGLLVAWNRVLYAWWAHLSWTNCGRLLG